MLQLSWELSSVLILSGLASVVFSYAYFLLNSFSRARLLQMVTGNEDGEKRIEKFLDLLPRTINVVLVIEIASKIVFILAILVFVAGFFGDSDQLSFWPLAWTFLIVCFWFVFFCRVLPFELGSWQEETIVLRLIPFFGFLGVVFFPVHMVLSPFRKWVDRTLTPSNPEEDAEQITEEIIDAIGEGEREGVIDGDEADMIENIMELRDAEVSEIMTPRTDMKAFEAATPLREAVGLAMKEGHSRVPVFREDADHVIGILYIKDVMTHWLEGDVDTVLLEKIVRKPYFIPETKKTSELMGEFRENKLHIAIVLDEYGGTAGLVTIEDILEEIVGEIVDEYDMEEEVEIRVIDPSTLDVSARVHVSDLNKEHGTNIPESDDFETIGGYIFSALGRVPGKEESVDAGCARLIVTDVGDRTVKRVRVEISRE
jgi:putative hemolysin